MNTIRNINKSDVIKACWDAIRRIVFMAPGIDEETADALAAAWRRLGPEAVTVMLDIDPEVARLGYGTLAGLELIQKAATDHEQAICHQPGIRICVLVADDTTLIFSPTPLLIEAGSKQPDRPNGVVLSAPPVSLSNDLGIGDQGIENRKVGLTIVRPQRIEELRKDLMENPPLKFDISRKERVFNAKLEFVEFEMEGCSISRHTVTIPPDLVGMAKMDDKTRNKLRSSFRLIEKGDVIVPKGKITEKALSDERNRIGKKYLIPIKGYGTVILRANKAAFEKEVESLREMVKAFRDALGGKLGSIYNENAVRLTKALAPAVAKSPPDQWTSALGPKPDLKSITEHLQRTLLESFGKPETLLREMKVNLVFKGVTYGTLTEKDFVEKAAAAFPSMKLMDEYDAARGHEEANSQQTSLL